MTTTLAAHAATLAAQYITATPNEQRPDIEVELRLGTVTARGEFVAGITREAFEYVRDHFMERARAHNLVVTHSEYSNYFYNNGGGSARTRVVYDETSRTIVSCSVKTSLPRQSLIDASTTLGYVVRVGTATERSVVGPASLPPRWTLHRR